VIFSRHFFFLSELDPFIDFEAAYNTMNSIEVDYRLRKAKFISGLNKDESLLRCG
jgi:hypothetical protein